jgi:hypothetical protein
MRGNSSSSSVSRSASKNCQVINLHIAFYEGLLKIVYEFMHNTKLAILAPVLKGMCSL